MRVVKIVLYVVFTGKIHTKPLTVIFFLIKKCNYYNKVLDYCSILFIFIQINLKSQTMKKVKVFSFCMLIVGFSVLLSGCYGSFELVKKVYVWNGSFENKFAKEAVFLGLNIIPVYGIASFVDGVIFNSVEFWTGKNPMALKAGENNIRFNGKNVRLVLNEDHAVIYHKDKVEATLDYNKADQSWYITRKGETHKYMSIHGNVLTAYSNSGQIIDSEAVAIK